MTVPSIPEGMASLTESVSPPDPLTAPWQQLSRRTVYRNPWIEVVEDDVRLPNGQHTIYGVVRCGPCVGVLPFVDADHVLLVQQFRYVAGHPTWEMPTGGVHPNESIEDAARRELAEEAGVAPAELLALSRYHTSKSVVEETAHLFIARGLRPVPSVPDATELLRRQVWPFDQVRDMVLRSEITDSMTIIAVLLAERLRAAGEGAAAAGPPLDTTR